MAAKVKQKAQATNTLKNVNYSSRQRHQKITFSDPMKFGWRNSREKAVPTP